MTASRAVRSDPHPDRLMFDLLGKTPDTAAEMLSSAFDLETPPVISVNPSWWPRLPLLPVQIRIETHR
jgi:hypothetical protein